GNWDSWIVRGVAARGPFPYWPVPGPLFHIHVAQLVGLAMLGIVILLRELRRAEGLKRNQIRFLIVAEIVGWSGGATNYPLWYAIPILRTATSWYRRTPRSSLTRWFATGSS